MFSDSKKIGAHYLGDGRTEWWVYAPKAKTVAVKICAPVEQEIILAPLERGYFNGFLDGIDPGSDYWIILDDQPFPDPASRYQPEGVFGPSQVINPLYQWGDSERTWQGLPFEDYLTYELHVGTFTPEGSYQAIIPHLDELNSLGITAIELMPVNQFSGQRNWGYDGVFPFAPQNTYGSPDDLKALVAACHQRGLAIILDVVYNHLGPEGNVLPDFGYYLTDKYRTPWGSAVNFDGPHNDSVRNYFIQNALMWIKDYHFDALRLDALHAVFDNSAYPFLKELSDQVHRYAHLAKRRIYLIAESSLNDTKFIRSHQSGGYALDAQWNDDFHHALYCYLTGDNHSYYQDFGKLDHIAKAIKEGYVLTGQYTEYWKCRHGQSSETIPANKFVVFSQNHDHIGNRADGERLCRLVDIGQTKIAAAMVILSPYIPLLFMGEEYAETAPFLYFTNHSDLKLGQAVKEGRSKEIITHYPESLVSDPQDPAIFLKSKINKALQRHGVHAAVYNFYKTLIQLRKSTGCLKLLSKKKLHIYCNNEQEVICVHRWKPAHSQAFIIYHFSKKTADVDIQFPAGRWHKALDSAEIRWEGDGVLLPDSHSLDVASGMTLKLSPHSVVVYIEQLG
ncbi:MAG: malto-oligosyltrehalose trehalohydrolase [Proteobacteria bacterium]|nr:malto-oligosyltrehalose trehalohydrolase [Pseudomonadota bacterium]